MDAFEVFFAAGFFAVVFLAAGFLAVAALVVLAVFTVAFFTVFAAGLAPADLAIFAKLALRREAVFFLMRPFFAALSYSD